MLILNLNISQEERFLIYWITRLIYVLRVKLVKPIQKQNQSNLTNSVFKWWNSILCSMCDFFCIKYKLYFKRYTWRKTKPEEEKLTTYIENLIFILLTRCLLDHVWYFSTYSNLFQKSGLIAAQIIEKLFFNLDQLYFPI